MLLWRIQLCLSLSFPQRACSWQLWFSREQPFSKCSCNMPKRTPATMEEIQNSSTCLQTFHEEELSFVSCLIERPSNMLYSVSQGRVYLDNCTRCHTNIEVEGQLFYLLQSKCTNTGPTSSSGDPVIPGAWHFLCLRYDSAWRKKVIKSRSAAIVEEA